MCQLMAESIEHNTDLQEGLHIERTTRPTETRLTYVKQPHHFFVDSLVRIVVFDLRGSLWRPDPISALDIRKHSAERALNRVELSPESDRIPLLLTDEAPHVIVRPCFCGVVARRHRTCVAVERTENLLRPLSRVPKLNTIAAQNGVSSHSSMDLFHTRTKPTARSRVPLRTVLGFFDEVST